MNRAEYLMEIMKKDVENIVLTEKDIFSKKLELIVDLKKAEEKCDSYEEMYEGDEALIMTAYNEYENVRSPLTQLESLLNDFKRSLIDHYEQFLIEKSAYTDEIREALVKSKYNVTKMDETVEIIKGVLI